MKILDDAISSSRENTSPAGSPYQKSNCIVMRHFTFRRAERLLPFSVSSYHFTTIGRSPFRRRPDLPPQSAQTLPSTRFAFAAHSPRRRV
jgi:hypothetical protein